MSSQFYLREILHSFDMFALSEHWLFKEQLDLITEFSETYQCHRSSSDNSPNFLSGRRGQGGVGLFWKNEYGDLITHLPIDSDRIVGVQFSFQLIDMPVDIFIFSVYFPSTNYPIDEYKECLALLWALFETYCDSGLIIILGDLNGSLGLMEGSRPCAGPQNERGKLLLEFMENFTLFATNLDCQCTGPLETFSFDDGRHKSTVDYIILPKSFSHLIKASSVYLWESDNLSDHVPVGVTIELTPLSDCPENSSSAVSHFTRKYIPWQKYSPSQIESIYTEPLSIALSDFKSDHHSNHSFEDLNNIIWSVCESNMTVYKSDPKSKLKKKKTVLRLPQGVRNIKKELNAAFNQWKSESQPTDSVSYFHYRNKKQNIGRH